MAGTFTTVDLSQLAAPDIIESLDFETIMAAMVADLQARDATFSALLESDPAYKVLEVCAYREVLLRQRVNSAAKAVMLAYATGKDLDQIGANYDVPRLVVTPADDTTIPPTPAVMESDAAFRARIQLSLEGYTTAGPAGSYVFWGLSASASVKDIQPVSPTPGQVTVYVLSADGDGTADSALLALVTAALNAEKTRPMTDQVTVQSASVVGYTIDAELVVYPGPDASTILATAQEAAAAYAADNHRIGYDVALSAVYKALHQPGVKQVNLTAPAADIVLADGQAPYCTAINLTVTVAGSV